MKKIYISPELLVVRLTSNSAILQASNPDVEINDSGSVDAEDVEVKGYITSDNIWDNQW